MNGGRPPLLCVMGPTASGKSTLAIHLAAELDCEVVSVDSALVYRGLDIGTAKPDAATRAAVPHHLIDIADPAERYSAARFRADALQAIESIHAAGRTPLLVGGTMLYFHALLHGLSEMPAADPELRAALDARAAREGWPALHAQLARVDPDAAARIHPNDPQRIQRALEVHELTGHPITALQARQQEESPYRACKLALAPADRERLHARIAERFEHMVRAGLFEEVARLHARADLAADLPALRAVGYRQVWQHLEGECDRQTAVERAIHATRQLAKRQLTWLKREPGLTWLDPSDPDWLAQGLKWAQSNLDGTI